MVGLNPPGQYADDRNLSARQRFWRHESPYFDIVGWVLGLAGLTPGMRVLDAGCGNGAYLLAMAGRQVRAAGCDLSMGMLRSAAHPALFSADVAALPVRDGAFEMPRWLRITWPAWRPTTRAGSPVPGRMWSRTCASRCRP